MTPEPIPGASSWSFSPDGRSIVAFATGEQGQAIAVIPSDGNSPTKFYEVFATTDDGPPQYRPDGSEIMFIGKEPSAASRGVYGLNPATGVVRPIVPLPSAPFDIHAASLSPDGKHIAYGIFDTSSDPLSARTHVVAVDGTGDVTVDTHPQSIADAGFVWSNDGSRLIIARFYTGDGSKARSAIVPIDRSSAGIEIACPPRASGDDCTADWTWSPDDSLLLGTVHDAGGETYSTQFLADPRTGQIRGAPWTASGHPAWQRLAR